MTCDVEYGEKCQIENVLTWMQVPAPMPMPVETIPFTLHPLDEMQQSIKYLTDRPGHFDIMMDPLVDSLSQSMHDESTMLEIIEMILVQVCQLSVEMVLMQVCQLSFEMILVQV